jgi:hypothetical protein
MTPQQRAQLRNTLFGIPAAASMIAAGDPAALQSYLNSAASPAFSVWKTAITRAECTVDGFDFTQVDNLTTGQARIWDWLFDNDGRAFNPSELGKRNAISECWKGSAAKVAVATFVLSLCKRAATNAEKLLATGPGNGTVGAPATMTFEELVYQSDATQLVFKDNGVIWTPGG